MWLKTFISLLTSLIPVAVSAASGPSSPTPKAAPAADALYQLSAKTLAGEPQPLSGYRGKVLLVVNTASECGYTPQYEGLEKLYQRYKDRGLVVLGFPSNDFGGQEPGTASQIATFCKTRFGVSFPLFEKTRTRGAEASPVWKFLAARHGEPQWNFHKYLVGKDGQVKKAFPSSVAPQSPELEAAIEAALQE
jgi:glutathione peroxidase